MKIAIATTTRAEYGLNRLIIKRIQSDPKLELQLLVGGTHLSKQYGETIKEIEADGIKDFYRIDFSLSNDSPGALSKSLGLAQISLAQIWEHDRPDFLLINGDRYELSPFVNTALLFGIPIGHIGGGEITEGVIDDCFRHAYSKFANLHFVCYVQYAENLQRMGEESWRIFNVGSEGVENILNMEFEDYSDIDNDTIMVSFHAAKNDNDIKPLLNALNNIDAYIIITSPGNETGSQQIKDDIKEFVDNHENASYYDSLGNKLFLNLLKYSVCIIGNSSAGIYEAPFLKVPTINIGDRQKGRIKAKSVIDVQNDQEKIKHVLNRILVDKNYVKDITSGKYPFGYGNTSELIIQAIKDNINNSSLINKKLEGVTN
jgi:GDP/UDP-N,N'-diacetylbacillosamine 2-epimerase (hydrolysing)